MTSADFALRAMIAADALIRAFFAMAMVMAMRAAMMINARIDDQLSSNLARPMRRTARWGLAVFSLCAKSYLTAASPAHVIGHKPEASPEWYVLSLRHDAKIVVAGTMAILSAKYSRAR